MTILPPFQGPLSRRQRSMRIHRSARLSWLLTLAAVMVLPTSTTAQEAPTGSTVRSGALEMTVGGRLQTQLNTTSIDGPAPSQLFIRRARIELDLRLTERVSGKVHPDFAGDAVELKDAYMQIDVTPTFRMLAGKAYRPFGLLEQTSSKRMLMVERGLRIRGLNASDEYSVLSGLGYSNRDIGLQIEGEPVDAPLGLAYRMGVFRGPLHGSVGNQDSYQMAARATVAPWSLVRLGAGWSSRHFAAPAPGGPDLRRGHAFEVDVEYGSFMPGLHLLAELAYAEINPFTGAGFWGGHAWIAYRTEPLGGGEAMLEPVFRISHGDPDDNTPMIGGTLFTPGINLYFGALNRIMINYDIWAGGGGSQDARSFKAMFQIAF